MSDEKKLTPEARDKLAAKLRANLGHSRPRPWLWAIGGMTLTGLLLWGLWRASQPPPPLPPLMLTAFDALPGDEMEAHLTAPGQDGVNLAGLTVHWKIAAAGAHEEGDAKTDARGIARFREGALQFIPGKHVEKTIEVSYVDPNDRSRGREARATLLNLPEACVLMSIDDLAGKDIDWPKADKLPPPPDARGERIVCAVGPVDAETYRAIRTWLGGLNPQPILVRHFIDELQKRLKDVPRRRP